MRFIIYVGDEKVAQVRHAKVAAKVAEMYGAGASVYYTADHGRMTGAKQLAHIDVNGQTIDPDHLEREARL